MSKVIPLHKEPLSVDEVLGQSHGFEDVVVIGFEQSGRLFVNWSGKPSVFELIGALFKAMTYLNGQDDD